MSDWRYKWVSARTPAGLDVTAITRAAKAGWVPVPYGEEPADIELPCEPDKLSAFMLHRMPEGQAQEREEKQAFLTDALADPRVMMAIAVGNIDRYLAELKEQGVEVSDVWTAPASLRTSGVTTEDSFNGQDKMPVDYAFTRKVSVAYEFLHSRGLA